MLQDIPEEDRKQEPKKYSEMREEGGMKKEEEEEGARGRKERWQKKGEGDSKQPRI